MQKSARISILITLLILVIPLIASLRQIAELTKRVEQIGKLKFKKEVVFRYFNKKLLEDTLKKRLANSYPRQITQKEVIYLHLLGFTRRMIDLEKYRKKILVNNVGGFYDSMGNEIVLLEEHKKINFINSMLIAHELRHAIQEQHYGIENILGERHSVFDDRRLAAAALLEGDATLSMLRIAGLAPDIMRGSGHSEALVTYLPLSNITAVMNVPRVLKKQLLMPYFNGLDFVNTIYEKRGYKGINAALSSPPLSTEQILHPRKYLKGEKPRILKISYSPPGYKRFHSGVVGEYFINVLLEDSDDQEQQVTGWGGDRYQIFRKGDFYFLAWELEWDEEKFCTHFFYRFQKFIQDRFAVKFRKGIKHRLGFLAGRSGNDFFFLYTSKLRNFYVRSNHREAMNRFINGGFYD